MVTALRELFAKSKEPSHEDKEAAVQTLAAIIDQAKALGHTFATTQIERSMAWGGKFVDALSSAWDIINNFVQRIADWIAGKESDGEDLTEDDIVDQIDSLAGRVADFEVHSAIEQEVLDSLQEMGVGMVECVAQPGACQLCLANVEAGPIPIGTAFPSGDTSAPFHGGCRCNVVAV